MECQNNVREALLTSVVNYSSADMEIQHVAITQCTIWAFSYVEHQSYRQQREDTNCFSVLLSNCKQDNSSLYCVTLKTFMKLQLHV